MEAPPSGPAAGRPAGPVTLGRFGRFLLVGGVATAVHYVTAFGLLTLAGWPPVRASATGFIVGALANYALNARFTFGLKGGHGRHLPRFAAVAGLGWLLNAAGMWGLLRLGLHPYLAQPVVTILVLFCNFLLNALWAMRPHSSPPPNSEGSR
ncbi:Putative flippase GtrA (transmembrane translocase of bactoprenol-linked glucose) [Roseateles sp. YR242]|uniref:GtrA family protein n=1 Tax=Roseateles sp. YR242 TaxID=1855305 RepID=UPI0008B6B29D|nr:GtrA family protein [Roseateles sp. YR242]SEK27984.1 Putative flippase GtrA (transmembrane translocase of bactoprenol-linked glucose) [Roseateles sp. YR242]